MEFSSQLSWLGTDRLKELDELKLQILGKGQMLLDLSMINPDLEPPRLLLDKLLEATTKPNNHRYAVSRGIRKLREAFALKYANRFSVKIDPESEVCITAGTKDAVVHCLTALTDPGDTVLVGRPTYPAHLSALHVNHLKPQFFDISADLDLMLRGIEEALDRSKAKVLLINFPNNPTAVVPSKSFFERLEKITRARGVFVLNDFVYGEMGYDGVHPVSLLAVSEFKEHGAETYSLSKAYNIAGWRVGALVGQFQLVRLLGRLKSHLDYGTFLPIQTAAAAALSSKEDLVRSTVSAYNARRRALINGLQRLKWPAEFPRAGASVWVKVPDFHAQGGSLQVCKRLLAEQHILATPGFLFGEEFDDHIRLALVVSEEQIHELVRRLEHFR